jgi:replication factor C small subunit
MSQTVQQLFTERFRPKDLATLIAPPRIKTELSRGLVQNLLLYGSPGIGKSSIAFIMMKDTTHLYINASSERGIDVIRERISKFCSSISLEGGREKLKVVILDEMDGATEEFFKALRAVMEKYANVCRFIATCNYINKIPEPVQSRFNCISLDPISADEEAYTFNEYKQRVGTILTAAGIAYTPEILDKFIKNSFPDMRRLMNKIQSFYLQGIKELNAGNFNLNFDFNDLFKVCTSKPDKPYENYKFIVSEFGSKVDEAMNALSFDFVEYLKSDHPNKLDKIPLIIISVAEYQSQRINVIDPLLSLLALVLKIQIIINQ